MRPDIGIGIVTYNRPELLYKLLDSIPTLMLKNVVVVNDGEFVDISGYPVHVIQHETNKGVGKSKNDALRYLMEFEEYEHFFLIEDDIFIKDDIVFDKYIEASQASGIQHFNYSQHGLCNLCNLHTREPNTLMRLTYDGVNLSFFPNCVGAFSYYSRKCLEEVGLIDERFYNACEHVEHTYRIIKAGMHPPFWWFADIENAQDYLGDEPWSLEKSTISGKDGHDEIVKEADKHFFKLHNMTPGQIPRYDIKYVGNKLKEIRSKYVK